MSETIVIQVRLLASLRTVAKARSIAVSLMNGATASDLLAAVQCDHPALAEHVVNPRGELLPGVLLLINGRHADFLQGLDTPLHPTDDVLLLPPVAGG
ncbi:MAG: MoaD family protein [Chloroflexi bacterium]|nr:MoaD family protein [Chloroflexota bacterium]